MGILSAKAALILKRVDYNADCRRVLFQPIVPIGCLISLEQVVGKRKKFEYRGLNIGPKTTLAATGLAGERRLHLEEPDLLVELGEQRLHRPNFFNK